MPLTKSASKEAFSSNVSRLTHEHYPQKQALAIAYSTQRKASKHADGGVINPTMTCGYSDGGPIAGFAGGGFPRGGFGGMRMPHPKPMKLTLGQQMGPPIGKIPALPKLPHLAKGGFVGFIPSAVPGRTDRHPINVPAGSYVLPAEHVSSLGQGNSIAGGKILHNMFPASVSDHAAHAAGMVKPMMPGRVMASAGAVIGGGSELVPVMVAGGEFVVAPQDVTNVGGGNLQKGHKHLDDWVMLRRKKHIETLKKLPPPAQD